MWRYAWIGLGFAGSGADFGCFVACLHTSVVPGALVTTCSSMLAACFCVPLYVFQAADVEEGLIQ